MLTRSLSVMALLCAVLALMSCSAAPAQPATPALPTVVPFTPLADVAQGGANRVTTLGYLVVDAQGARLVDSIGFEGGAITVLTPPEQQIWSGDAASQVQGALLGNEQQRYALVIVEGEIQGPGAFGAGGQYHWQCAAPQVRVVAPHETSISALLAGGQSSARRVVRLNGHLLLSDTSALLIDKLGAGGIPAPGAQQIKLRRTARDAALETRLQPIGGQGLRAGPVQVEGYLDGGALTVLSIQLLGQ